MDYVFDILMLIGGLSLFLFGMNIMGEALERRAGSGLKNILGKMTTNKLLGFLTGLAVTAIIQSSSATTVMVVGFVNSGLMTLRQAINVTMGANVGTTITAWVLSLSGISSSNVFVKLLKPTSFTPVLALIGIIFYMFTKNQKKKDTGTILLGFAILMFGMDTMSSSVAFLEEIEGFRQLFIMFQNPILGVLAGALLTAILQSSSASVGILQALASSTSSITFGSAIPIIMGQNIGTCVTALISSVGANKNARRAAFVHLSFNVIGSAILLTAFSVVKYTIDPAILSEQVGVLGIPLCHTAFNILCTVIMFPMGTFLEKLAHKAIPDSKEPEKVSLLDERLLATPTLALDRCRALTQDMARSSYNSVLVSLDALKNGYTEKAFKTVKDYEDETDRYEDELGTYLVKLSSHAIGENESAEAAMLLRVIGDYERIADHSVNLIESAEELKRKGIHLSEAAEKEISVLCGAVDEILSHSISSFTENDFASASHVEPLEEVIDSLKSEIRARHIARLQSGNCTIEAGFILSDLLTNLERISDHCSNIALSVLDAKKNNLNLHETTRTIRTQDSDFLVQEEQYAKKYSL